MVYHRSSLSSQDTIDHNQEFCKYNNSSCHNKRAMSKNGKRKLRMCTFHRHKANKYQQKYQQRKKQQTKAVSIGSPTNDNKHHPSLQVFWENVPSLDLDDITNVEGTNEMLEITDFTMLSMDIMVTYTTPTVEDPFGTLDMWGSDAWFDGSF